MTLAATTDVEALLQGDISPDDDPKIVALLEMVSGNIESLLGRPAEPDVVITGETHNAPFRTRAIQLDRWPIASVQEVRENGTALDPAGYTVDLRAGIITRRAENVASSWFTGLNTIEVDYTTAEVPGLRGLAAAITARAFRAGRAYATRPTVMEGFKQLTIGRWSGTLDTGTAEASNNAINLTEVEKSAIRAWRDRRP